MGVATDSAAMSLDGTQHDNGLSFTDSATGGVSCQLGTPQYLYGDYTNVGGRSSVQVTASGKVHVSYFDATNKTLKYATNASGSWKTELPDSNAQEVGSNSALALGLLDSVHIVYQDYKNDDLKYATNASGAWQIETVDSAGAVGAALAIAVSKAGHVYLSYSDDTNGRQKFATNASGAWQTETIGTVNPTLGEISLALDASGKAHLSSYDKADNNLKYMTNVSGTWQTVTVDAGPLVGRQNSLAVDNNGKIHIAYQDDKNDKLKYATNLSGSWQSEVADPGYQTGTDTAISIGSDGAVHISYTGDVVSVVKHAVKLGGKWTTETVAKEDPGLTAPTPDMALDSQNKLHITYWHIREADLHYVTNRSGSWADEVVDDPAAKVFSVNSVADSKGQTHLVYRGGRTHSVNHMINVSGQWQAGTPKLEPAPTGLFSAVLDRADHLHIAYCDERRKLSMYANNSTGTWKSEPIGGSEANKVNCVVPRSLLTVDALGKVYMSYYDSAKQTVRYITNKSGTWQPQDVFVQPMSKADVAASSIAVDKNGQVHLLYEDVAVDALFYATDSGSNNFQPQFVAAADVLGSIAMYLDAAGHFHAAYADQKRGVVYVTNKSGQWKDVVVESDSCKPPALAVDHLGRAHISYYNNVKRKPLHANNLNGSWQVLSIDTASALIDQDVVVSLDKSNQPNLTYVRDGQLVFVPTTCTKP